MSIDWKHTRVAVLGGKGFLGSHVVERLIGRGCRPSIPSTSEGWDFRQLDKANEYFQSERPEVVFNCAARQGGLEYQRLYPAEIFFDNMRMGLNTLHAAQAAEVRKYVNVVAACSYPGYLQGIATEDDYWSGPLHDSVLNYGFTKKAQVVQGWCYRKQFGFNSIHLLMTNLYGPGEHLNPDRSHALAALLLKFYEASRRGDPQVTLWGTGVAVREWLYVDDAADALIACAERYDQAEPLNVSVAGGLTIRELAELIREIVGYEGKIAFDPSKPDGALVKTFSNERIEQLVGWRPTTPLREGIARTLAWLEAHYEHAVAAR